MARIRRTVSTGTGGEDIAFLIAVIADLGMASAHASSRLDHIAAMAHDGEPNAIADYAREASRAITQQSAYCGIWHRTAIERPTGLPNASVAVLFCTQKAEYPKQGFYTTDQDGIGHWEIYSALQDHVLDYCGPEPEIWALAPARPDPSVWVEFDQIPEERFLRRGSDHEAAIAADLTAIEKSDLIPVVSALPSLVRLCHELDQIRNAHMRTAEVLGAPATAFGPAEAAARLRLTATRHSALLTPPEGENENQKLQS